MLKLIFSKKSEYIGRLRSENKAKRPNLIQYPKIALSKHFFIEIRAATIIKIPTETHSLRNPFNDFNRSVGKKNFDWTFFALTFAAFLWASSYREFWQDEVYTIESLTGVFEMLVNGAPGQCSPSPLFYVIQKLYFNLSSNLSAHLMLARLPSAMAASAFLSLVVLSLRNTPIFGFIIAFSIIQNEVFISHATETRPFTFWLLFSMIASLFVVRILNKKESITDYILLGIVGLLGILTSTGMLFF
jgi:hypothetical protein